jgi:hypothetical protein
MNALTLKNLKLGDIHGYEKNAKIHSERQMQQIIVSINQFGVNNPILIDENNEIIAGHNPSLCLIYFEISTNIFPGKELEMLTDIGILSSVLLNTLIIGSGYAIVAMAFRLMFSVSPFFNMALGASVALGAYLGYALLPKVNTNRLYQMNCSIVSRLRWLIIQITNHPVRVRQIY